MILDKNILKVVFPFAGTTLITIGYLKLALYYKAFNIDIHNYVDIAEVLTAFLSDIILICLFVLLIWLTTFFHTGKEEAIKTMLDQSKIEGSSNAFDRLISFLFLSPFISFTTLISLIGIVVKLIFFRNQLLEDPLGIFILSLAPATFIFGYILFEFKTKYQRVFKASLNSTYHNLIVYLFIFLLATTYSLTEDISNVKAKKSKNISFMYDEESVITSNNLIYLGQTKDYLFLRDAICEESLVIERSRISHFKVLNN